MEHKLISGGEQLLPFARSRIKALRATGLTYASQQFEIDGVSVKVRIEGEHEYIEISGGRFDYQTTPTSAEHIYGVVDANLVKTVSFSTSGQTKKRYVDEGVIDWVSYDGLGEDGSTKFGANLITWNSGLPGRYNPVRFESEAVDSDTFLRINGEKIDVGHVPFGAAIANLSINGENTKVFLFSTKPSATTIEIRYFYASNVVNGYATSSIAGTYTIPQADIALGNISSVRDHIFFSGDGMKFAALVSTPATLGLSQSLRFFKVSGQIVQTASVLTASFVSVQLSAEVAFAYAPGPYSSSYTEYIGVDVKVSGEIVEIKLQSASTSTSPVFEIIAPAVFTYDTNGYALTQSGSTRETSSHGRTIAKLLVDDEAIHECVHVAGHNVEDVNSLVEYVVSPPAIVSSSFTLYEEVINTGFQNRYDGLIIHDIDGRFGTFAATKTVLGSSSKTVVRATRTFNSVTLSNVIEYFPATETMVIDASNYIVVRDLSGTVIEKPHQERVPVAQALTFTFMPMQGTEIDGEYFGAVTKSFGVSVYITGRRVASRRSGSFIASTAPFIRRSQEATANPAWLETDRVLNIVGKKNNVAITSYKAGMTSADGPQDTEIALFPLQLIYR